MAGYIPRQGYAGTQGRACREQGHTFAKLDSHVAEPPQAHNGQLLALLVQAVVLHGGSRVVMPAHSRGAASTRGRLAGTFRANLGTAHHGSGEKTRLHRKIVFMVPAHRRDAALPQHQHASEAPHLLCSMSHALQSGHVAGKRTGGLCALWTLTCG